MRSHRFARLLRVTPLNRIQNPLVMNLAAFRSAGNSEDAQPLLAQKPHDGIEQRKDERVGRALRQCQMKIKVGFDVGLRILSGSIHCGNRFTHGRQFRLLDAHRSQRRNLRLENGSHLGKMCRTFRLTDLHHQIKRLAHRLRGTVGDESASPRVSFDQPFFAQRFYRFAHCGAAYAKALGQFAFCGKLITGLQIAFDDRFFNLLNDLFVESRRTN